MKLALVLLVLLPVLLEVATAARVPAATSTINDPYGRVHRNSRMSGKSSKVKIQKVEEDDEEGDDEDADDEEDADDDVDDDDSFYPPDFEKLFPNPDGKPVGPNAKAYSHNHPTNVQHGKPSHGPGSLHGPAALRGPVPQHQPKPHERGGPSRPPPNYRDGPARRYSSRPHYRTELIGYIKEPINQKVSSVNSRQIYQPKPVVRGQNGYIYSNPRQVPVVYRPGTNAGYQNRRVISYPALAGGNQAFYVPSYSNNYGGNQVSYPGISKYYPGNRYPGNRYLGYPGGFNSGQYIYRGPGGYNGQYVYRRPYYPVQQKFVPTQVIRGRDDSTESFEVEDDDDVQTEPQLARIYNPWSRNPLIGDHYNPQFVVNPTEMKLRRHFRYHPSQRIPSQRIPIYSGHWGNPRNQYHSPTISSGTNYHTSYFGS